MPEKHLKKKFTIFDKQCKLTSLKFHVIHRLQTRHVIVNAKGYPPQLDSEILLLKRYACHETWGDLAVTQLEASFYWRLPKCLKMLCTQLE